MFSIMFVCFLWDLCWAMGLSVCSLRELCLALDLVIWTKHSLLIVFGIFGSPEKDRLLVLKSTGYCSSSYIMPSCQATAPSFLK